MEDYIAPSDYDRDKAIEEIEEGQDKMLKLIEGLTETVRILQSNLDDHLQLRDYCPHVDH